MVPVSRLALFVMLALSVSASHDADAGKNNAARSELGRINGAGLELSRSLQQLPANPKSAGTLREYQRRITHVAETVTRANILLNQKPPDPGDLKKIEASLRAEEAKIRKLQERLTRDRSQIQFEIANVEAGRETVRNERNMESSQFENANQKATQYLKMLSSVLKTLNEMQTGIIRNLR